MAGDEVIDEVHAARRAYAEAHGFDLRRMCEDLKKRERASGRKPVTLPPRAPRRRSRD